MFSFRLAFSCCVISVCVIAISSRPSLRKSDKARCEDEGDTYVYYLAHPAKQTLKPRPAPGFTTVNNSSVTLLFASSPPTRPCQNGVKMVSYFIPITFIHDWHILLIEFDHNSLYGYTTSCFNIIT